MTCSCLPAGLPSSRNTPSPIDPDSIQVPISYEPDPADLALSSVPGQEMFDPRKRKFSAEELKPQPMIKKARKVFIPEDLKVIWSWFTSMFPSLSFCGRGWRESFSGSERWTEFNLLKDKRCKRFILKDENCREKKQRPFVLIIIDLD